MTQPGIQVRDDDVLIIGSGIGGLVCALSVAPRSVTVITKTRSLEGGSSVWAQGGIAAAIGPGDSPAAHAADTIAAGAGISNPEQVAHLTEAGVDGIRWLIEEGVPFDRNADGALDFGKEAAHRAARIIHAGGDATGYVLMQSLIERVRATPTVAVLEDTFAYELVLDQGRIRGVLTHSNDDGWVLHRAPVVIIATGGIGMAWQHTTNPVEATGDGLAMAARAGARLADLEFMQFHPTALAASPGGAGASLPLLTEALRGAGAVLIDASGKRFMTSIHPDAELAPRDVVARAIHQRLLDGGQVYLDIRPVLGAADIHEFPTAIRFAQEAGLDPRSDPLPVAPAAHYHMGGVVIDKRGRTSIAGLWACGEVATTGIHGANRLASNSLLEALVFARDVASDVLQQPAVEAGCPIPEVPRLPAAAAAAASVAAILSGARASMSRHVGIERDGAGLGAATRELADLEQRLEALVADLPVRGDRDGPASNPGLVRSFAEARNVLLVCRLVSRAALNRTESRGAHYRRDHPEPDPRWQDSQRLSMAELARS